MQVGLLLRACLILNRIQTLCLFKGTSPKVPRQLQPAAPCPLGVPHAFSSPPLSSPRTSTRPLLLGVPPKSKAVGRHLLCWFLVSGSSIIKKRKVREDKKKKIQKMIKELIAIQTSLRFAG